jgi:processive 1,2-diacylglycerol beta-glucosyltransferase
MAFQPKIVVLYSPAGGGHRSVANAVANALLTERGDASVEVLDVTTFAPSWFRYDLAWKALQLHGGHAWDWVFRKTDRGLPTQPDRLRKQVNRILLHGLTKYIKEHQPDRVVCTHYLPAIAVSRLVEEKKIRANLSIVVTDYVAHEAWIYPGVNDYFVPSPAVARSIMRRDVHWNRVHITGIPIAPIMDEPPVALAHSLPLKVLVLTGGVPADLVVETLESFSPDAPLKLTVVAGTDVKFKQKLEQVVKARGIDATVHAQLPGLRDVLDASHVVVTKTGGLVTTECFARGRAMVMPWPAFGQEHGNLLKIIESGAGLSASDHRDTGSLVAGLARDPDRWRELGQRAQKAAIRGSARRVARFLLKGLPGSSNLVVSGIHYAAR